MNNYIVVLEINGLKVSKSLKINGLLEKPFYLYPYDYFEKINILNKEIAKLKDLKNDNFTTRMTPGLPVFETGDDKYSYLIAELTIDLIKSSYELREEINNIFDLLLRINSMIFDFFIKITRIFIFKKVISLYKLKRVIQQEIIEEGSEEATHRYKSDKYCRDLEISFRKLENNKLLTDIIYLFYEFLYAKKANAIDTKIIYMWNYLEHLTYIYLESQNRNLLVDPDKFENLKEKISSLLLDKLRSMESLMPIKKERLNHEIGRILNEMYREMKNPIPQTKWRNFKNILRTQISSEISNQSILFDEYTPEKIAKLFVTLLDNFPPILEMINLMISHSGFQPFPSGENSITYIYKIRNYLYHTSIKLDSFYPKLKDIVNRKERKFLTKLGFRELLLITKHFETFLERLTLHILNIPILKSIKKTGTIYAFAHPKITGHANEKTYFTEKLTNIKIEYMKEGKYAPLLKFVKEVIKNYEKDFKNSELEGCCFNEEDKDTFPLILRFTDKFEMKAKFNKSGIGYPKIYKFYVFYNQKLNFYDVIIEFDSMVYISNTSNEHGLYTTILDFWVVWRQR